VTGVTGAKGVPSAQFGVASGAASEPPVGSAAEPLSDLRRARDQSGEVTNVENLGAGIVEISVRLPHLAATARPGEFAQLRAWEGIEPLLRRPMSVAWTEGDVCAFVIEAVGVGTRILARLRPGDPLRALGPLGRGFRLDPAPASALIVSGGLGCAPFPLLVRELRRAGCAQVTVLSGAATAARLYPPERFARGDAGITVVESTDDGSRGRRGVVTGLVPDRCDGSTVVYACGPNPMLAALAITLRRTPRPPVRAEVSLEAPMGCGFGTCLGCALPALVRPEAGGDGRERAAEPGPGTGEGGPGAAERSPGAGEGGNGPAGRRTAWALCCRRGPVMEVDEVAWPELLALPPAHVA